MEQEDLPEEAFGGAERKLVVNVIDALNLPWRKAPSYQANSTEQFRRECCPFVEVSLVDVRSRKVIDSLHFQTKRERCKEDDHEKEFLTKLKKVGGNMKAAMSEMTIQEHRKAQPASGASATWNETFTFNARPEVFWSDVALRVRCWDRDFLHDTPLGEVVVNLSERPFTIGSENRKYHLLTRFGKKWKNKPLPNRKNKSKKGKVVEVDISEQNSKTAPKILFGFRFGKVEESDKLTKEERNGLIPILMRRRMSGKQGVSKKVPRPGELPSAAPGLVGYFPALLQSKEHEAMTSPLNKGATSSSPSGMNEEDINKQTEGEEGTSEVKPKRNSFISSLSDNQLEIDTSLNQDRRSSAGRLKEREARKSKHVELVDDKEQEEEQEEEQEGAQEEDEDKTHEVDAITRARHIWNHACVLNLARKKFLEHVSHVTTTSLPSTTENTPRHALDDEDDDVSDVSDDEKGEGEGDETIREQTTVNKEEESSHHENAMHDSSGFDSGVFSTDGINETNVPLTCRVSSNRKSLVSNDGKDRLTRAREKERERKNKKIEKHIQENCPAELVLLLNMIRADTKQTNKKLLQEEEEEEENDKKEKLALQENSQLLRKNKILFNKKKGSKNKNETLEKDEDLKSKDITTLTLRRTPLKLYAIPFFSAISENRTLVRVDLSFTMLSSDSVLGLVSYGEAYSQSSLCYFIETSPSIRDLSLNDNPELDDAGVKGISLALQASKLERLGLARCGLTTEGCISIADSLKTNRCLKYLNLDGNGIGPDGGESLGKALKVNNVLEELRIGENNLVLYDLPHQRHEFQAVHALTDAMRFNQTLQYLGLACNSICGVDYHGRGELDPSALTAFSLSLKLNAGMRHIDLSGNTGAANLKTSFQVNAPRVTVVYEVKRKRW